jgi:hypothetical protein
VIVANQTIRTTFSVVVLQAGVVIAYDRSDPAGSDPSRVFSRFFASTPRHRAAH